MFVISHLPRLATLDDTPVSEDERRSAHQLYGARMRRRSGKTS